MRVGKRKQPDCLDSDLQWSRQRCPSFALTVKSLHVRTGGSLILWNTNWSPRDKTYWREESRVCPRKEKLCPALLPAALWLNQDQSSLLFCTPKHRGDTHLSETSLPGPSTAWLHFHSPTWKMKSNHLNLFWATQAERQVAIMCSDQQKATWWIYIFIRIIPGSYQWSGWFQILILTVANS